MKIVKPKIGKVKATAETKLLVDSDPRRKRLFIQNLGDKNIEVVSSKDSHYGDGVRIASNGNYPILHYCQGAYWIVAESGTQDVRFEEDLELG